MSDVDIVGAVHNVHCIIVIDEQAAIIETFGPETGASDPRTGWRGCGVDEGVPEVDTANPIPRFVALTVAHGRGPCSSSIGLRGDKRIVVSKVKRGY